MKLVRGRALTEAIDANTSAGQRVSIVMRIAEALAFAHKAGVIHRDLKPSNVMVGDFGEVLVLDWGVAGWLGERASDDTTMMDSPRGEPATVGAATAPTDATLPAGQTATGTILGTPGWMSPEQARGNAAQTDARTDVWGLGALLVWSFTGRAPELRLGGEPDIPPDIPRPMISIARRALALDPAARYPGADAFLSDLRAWRDGDRVSAHHESVPERIGRFVTRYRVPILLIVAYIIARVAIYVWGRI